MNKKGFAATGILYTILVLFILLITGLVTLLYSRNQLLIQIKKEISTDIPINRDAVCQPANVQNPGAYTIGDTYSCNPGDGETRIFYLIESTDDEVVLWYTQEVASSILYRSCSTSVSHDINFCYCEDYLMDEVFGNLGWTSVVVSLPNYDQIYGMANSISLPSIIPNITEAWLETGSKGSYYIVNNQLYSTNCESSSVDSLPILPVITVKKSDITIG